MSKYRGGLVFWDTIWEVGAVIMETAHLVLSQFKTFNIELNNVSVYEN